MIRVVMQGRLGNNLFQYAAARALADRHGTGVLMDGSGFDGTTWKELKCLRQLPLRAKVDRRYPVMGRLSRRLFDRHPWELRSGEVFREDKANLGFDSRFLSLSASCVLKGYFQTWRYFESIEEPLRRDLSLQSLKPRPELEKWAEKLESPHAVAVHVRRGDYVGNVNVGILDDRYYRQAIDQIRQVVIDAELFFFSDDPDEVAPLAAEMGGVVVDPRWESPLEAMRLMSTAGHHIIANSSFSWWAAWLGKKAGQQVMLPSEWSRGKMVSPIEEKCCPGWKTVKLEGDQVAR